MRHLLAVLLLAALASPCRAAEEVLSIPTRPGVNLWYLLDQDKAATPKVVVISFVGGLGGIGLERRAQKGPVKFGPTANFLVRIKDLMTDPDVADAIVDSPSDQLPDGMSDRFRLGQEHATDIRTLIGALKQRFPGAKIFLLGTSRGTISAAALGASLADVVQGVVLTSTVTNADRTGSALSGFDFGSIKVPVLLVHHHDDGCRTSPYSGAERLSKRFPLVSVSGGDPPQSEPCEAMSQHGYLGSEAPTAQGIRNWMLGREFAREIN
ncbi:MAG: alpha/beta hydrolase [Betaproteobacteria bacterium]